MWAKEQLVITVEPLYDTVIYNIMSHKSMTVTNTDNWSDNTLTKKWVGYEGFLWVFCREMTLLQRGWVNLEKNTH